MSGRSADASSRRVWKTTCWWLCQCHSGTSIATCFGLLNQRVSNVSHQGDVPLAVTRAATLLLPGIGDHFPWDYESALRDALLQGGAPLQ